MRCFLAIELPTDVRKQLSLLQEQLAELDHTVRWTRPELIHATVKFLGEVPDAQVPEVCRVAVEIAGPLACPRIVVRGTGCFPPSGPARIVWAGIEGPPPELVACHAACEKAFAELGYPPEERAFRPHLTLGRSRDPRGARQAREAVRKMSNFACEPFIAGQLVVFQSVLDKSGPTYTPLVAAPFRS